MTLLLDTPEILTFFWFKFAGKNLVSKDEMQLDTAGLVFALQMQHVTVKGWKDFSSIFSDGAKTSLPGDGSPGEDSSLLGGGAGGKSGKKWVPPPGVQRPGAPWPRVEFATSWAKMISPHLLSCETSLTSETCEGPEAPGIPKLLGVPD